MPDFTAFKNILSGDIAFLAKKEFDGKIRTDEGSATGTGTLASLTANTGKDMYLAKAQVNYLKTNGSGASLFTCELKLNDVIVETWTSESFVGNLGNPQHNFNAIGLKVVADDIIKLQITVIGTISVAEGSLVCWEEDSGGDPTA